MTFFGFLRFQHFQFFRLLFHRYSLSSQYVLYQHAIILVVDEEDVSGVKSVSRFRARYNRSYGNVSVVVEEVSPNTIYPCHADRSAL
jgi:hypothetical protein